MTSASSVSRSVSVGQTLAELGEFGLIRAVSELASAGGAQTSGVLVGPGDDAALVAVGGGEVLVCTDVAKAIADVKGVTLAEDVTGPYDVIVRAEAETVDELGRLVVARVQSVDGITRTLTCPVVNI